PVLTMAELGTVGNPPGTAFVQVILVDCLGNRLAGCTISAPSATKIEYTTGGVLDMTATMTDSTRFVLVPGLDPAKAPPLGTCPTVGAMRAPVVTFAADAMFFLEIGP